MTAERTSINPWPWSVAMGFQQAQLVDGASRTLYCSGQTSVDADGAPQHAGDMTAQIVLALDNLEAVVTAAGMTLGNVVRLNIYTTDVDGFLASYGVAIERMAGAGSEFTSTLLGVQRLAFPELMVELEATAVD